MTAKKAEKYFALICLVASLVLLALSQYSFVGGSALKVMAISNLLLYGLTLFLFRYTHKSFSDPNPNVSIRAIMSSMMIKFFVLAVAALLYILYMRKEVSVPVLAVAAVLYVLYTVAEVRALLLLLKTADHA
jgi:hypothetical protein